MPIAQVTLLWQGFTGAPGYTTLNFLMDAFSPTEGLEVATAANTFADAVSGFISDGTSITVDTEIKWFDVVTGTLIDISAVDPAFAPNTGSSGAIGPAPVGACISWGTDAVVDGRRQRGRSFLVPLAAAAYQNNGTLTDLAVTNLTAAGVDLMADSDNRLCVWHRPVGGAGGAATTVLTARVTDKAAVLRSRRD